VPVHFLCPSFFSGILFGSTTLLTGMTGISLHMQMMQWPLTSQLHGSFSQREQLVFHSGSNSMPSNPTTYEFTTTYNVGVVLG
jgi:hypothetical protein